MTTTAYDAPWSRSLKITSIAAGAAIAALATAAAPAPGPATPAAP